MEGLFEGYLTHCSPLLYYSWDALWCRRARDNDYCHTPGAHPRPMVPKPKSVLGYGLMDAPSPLALTT